jgi:thymidylate synthase
MLVSCVRNVCEALPMGLSILTESGVREQSRAGPVLVAPSPVTTVTSRPTERVLFSSIRDANPFFHLVEAIWMLAGRDDSDSLDYYVRDFGSRFAEKDGRVHGAYGHRWRRALGLDQLTTIVDKLRCAPSDRQCVLQMWDACENSDLTGEWRDRPCNTHAYLRVRDSSYFPSSPGPVLDLTVCCRSNDAVWGAHGANAVHFSVLQEYLAARIGVGVGTLYQVSNNYHVYESELRRLAARGAAGSTLDSLGCDHYSSGVIGPPARLVDDPPSFDDEVRMLMEWHVTGNVLLPITWRNRFLDTTVRRAIMAHWMHRERSYDGAAEMAEQIEAPDWRVACVQWLSRRRRSVEHDEKRSATA